MILRKRLKILMRERLKTSMREQSKTIMQVRLETLMRERINSIMGVGIYVICYFTWDYYFKASASCIVLSIGDTSLRLCY